MRESHDTHTAIRFAPVLADRLWIFAQMEHFGPAIPAFLFLLDPRGEKSHTSLEQFSGLCWSMAKEMGKVARKPMIWQRLSCSKEMVRPPGLEPGTCGL